jgi:hypothetical protein
MVEVVVSKNIVHRAFLELLGGFMKITIDWLDQFFDIFSRLGKMLLYLYQLFRGKL